MSKPKIMIVDDSKVDQIIIANILEGFEIFLANDGLEAIELLHKIDIDIMILDLNMPRMNGFEVLEKIKKDFTEIDLPILILTNYEEIESEIKGLELGAVDYIRKPLNAASLLKRLEVHLHLLHAKNKIKIHNENLEREVALRTKELLLTRDITIKALVGLLEVRDIESSNHTRRTMLMMKTLCEHLSLKESFRDILTPEKIDILYRTSPLHDIGKVGIPDKILLKPGKLTPVEFEFMKEHVKFGVDAIQSELDEESIDHFMQTAINVISAHHERYDGQGYPNQLSGKDIPIEGRLMAVIDVYDALSSKRVYKEAYDHSYSVDILLSERGKHFDPEIVDAFIEIQEDIHNIAMKYRSKKVGDLLEIR